MVLVDSRGKKLDKNTRLLRSFRFQALASILPVLIAAALLTACSFDYGDRTAAERDLPDIIMENVEYVRVRSSDIQARFLAERAERFEERGLMELRNFSFEQFGNQGEVDAFGRAGSASVELDSMDIFMADGVRLEVESEEIAIETVQLEWRDRPRTLLGGTNEEVHITREDGTSFAGVGFRADARQRTWEFSGVVMGTYVHEDDEEDEDEDEAPGDMDLAAYADDTIAIPEPEGGTI